MAEYIDREALLRRLPDDLPYKGSVKRVLMQAPTADVVEVRHGEWIEKDDGWDGVLYTCSVCNCDWCTIDGTPFENNMRYCPECGAKMDGERREG